MLTIAGGILIAVFALWFFFEVVERDEEIPVKKSHYTMTIWGPRIIVAGALCALAIILINLL